MAGSPFSRAAGRVMARQNTQLLISIVIGWEIIVKPKLNLGAADIEAAIGEMGAMLLPIKGWPSGQTFPFAVLRGASFGKSELRFQVLALRGNASVSDHESLLLTGALLDTLRDKHPDASRCRNCAVSFEKPSCSARIGVGVVKQCEIF